MLSYILIAGACSFLCWKAFGNHPGSANTDFETDLENDVELIKAIARYETPQWQMLVATDLKMGQEEWNHTLQILTSNIQNMKRA